MSSNPIHVGMGPFGDRSFNADGTMVGADDGLGVKIDSLVDVSVDWPGWVDTTVTAGTTSTPVAVATLPRAEVPARVARVASATVLPIPIPGALCRRPCRRPLRWASAPAASLKLVDFACRRSLVATAPWTADGVDDATGPWSASPSVGRGATNPRGRFPWFEAERRGAVPGLEPPHDHIFPQPPVCPRSPQH